MFQSENESHHGVIEKLLFFSREETRPHVHVSCPDGEAKFWLEPAVELAKSHGLSTAHLTELKKTTEERAMTSSMRGEGTSRVEVGNIDQHGLWLLVDDKEYFLPHDDFPWFRKATLEQILNVELLHATHLHWPALDVDLSLDSLDHPQSFPLIYK